MRRIIFFLIVTLLFSTSIAKQKQLTPDEAMQVGMVVRSATQVEVDFKLAPAVYLYRDKLKFEVDGQLLDPKLPAAQLIDDKLLHAKFNVYFKDLKVLVTLPKPLTSQEKQEFVVTYQGCVQDVMCFLPMTKAKQIDLNDISSAGDSGAAGKIAPVVDDSVDADTEFDKYSHILFDGSFFAAVSAFFLIGMLLSLTPCVWPMIPILSSIVLGDASGRRLRGFVLSAVYVLGVAVAYALTGLVISWFGFNLQAVLQHAVITWVMAILFFVFGLGMMGVFKFAMPYSLVNWASRLRDRQKSGTLLGVFVMGLISALVISPCLTPPLAASLVYLAQKGDVWLGASSLFAMGIGLGVPLILLGTFGARLHPRSGKWMTVVNYIIGFLLIAVAIWVLMKVVSDFGIMILFAVYCLGVSFVLCRAAAVSRRRWAVYFLAALFAIYGVGLGISAFMGGVNPLAPWTIQAKELNFITVSSPADLDAVMARDTGKPVLIEFTADWCVPCKEMELVTFQNEQVRQRLRKFLLVKVDLTKDTAGERALMARYKVIGPPALIIVDVGHKTVSDPVVGFVSPEKLLALL
jgi:thioredoxin:protein disulfide reductase